MTRRNVLLWRHGRTSWNLAQRFQGHTDVPLDELGRQQAAAAAGALARRAPVTIASSDLGRAAATAQALADLVDVPVRLDRALREADAGRWEGMTHTEIRQQDPDALARWRSDPAQRPGGTGETRGEVGSRVAGAVRRYGTGLAVGETAVLVTHGGAARAAVAQLLGIAPADWHRMTVLDNCCWAELDVDHDDQFRLRAYNVGW